MRNAEVAAVLYELADVQELLQIPWKPIAVRRAARTIESLSKDIEVIYRQGGAAALQELPGIGEGIAGKIAQFLDEGKVDEYEKLRKRIPKGVEDMLHVPGLGPKKAFRLFKERRITTIAALERAAKSGRIRSLSGFGEKSEQDILRGIGLLKMGAERKLLGSVLPFAREIEARLKAIPGVKDVVVSGSIRRMKETVKDLDFLVISKDAKKVMDVFTKMPEVVSILAKGPTKSAVILKPNLQADVRVLEEKSFGAALQYFTGSKEHNVRLRQLAIKKGLKLNEYGLFKGAKMVAGKTEHEVYKALGLPYIEPELRENQGEFERKPLVPIPYDAIRGDFHMHTTWSDGRDSMEEMVKACKALGYQYMAISDHSVSERIANGMDERRVLNYLDSIDNLQRKTSGIRILKSSEVSIRADGSLDYPDSILKRFDIVIVSIHSGFKQPKDVMTRRVLRALSNPYVTIWGHPTARLINEREPINVDLDKVFRLCAERGVWVEVNSSPKRLDLKDMHVRQAIDAGCKLVIDTDSHAADQLKNVELGVATARRGWAEAKDVVNTLPWKRLEKLISRKRSSASSH